MVVCFFLMIRRPPRSTLFPYTTPLPISRRGAQGALRPHPQQHSAGQPAHPGAPAREPSDGRWPRAAAGGDPPADGRRVSLTVRSEEHTSELQSRQYLVCRLLLEKKNTTH